MQQGAKAARLGAYLTYVRTEQLQATQLQRILASTWTLQPLYLALNELLAGSRPCVVGHHGLKPCDIHVRAASHSLRSRASLAKILLAARRLAEQNVLTGDTPTTHSPSYEGLFLGSRPPTAVFVFFAAAAWARVVSAYFRGVSSDGLLFVFSFWNDCACRHVLTA